MGREGPEGYGSPGNPVIFSRVAEWCRQHPWVTGPVVGAVLGFILGYAGGRYATPTKVQVLEHTEYVDRWHVREQEKRVEVEGPIRWKIRKVITPGPPGSCGPTIVEEREGEKGPTTTTTDTTTVADGDSSGSSTSERLELRDPPRFMVAAVASVPFSGEGLARPQLGLVLTGRVIGPITAVVGAEGNAQGGSLRVGVGLSF